MNNVAVRVLMSILTGDPLDAMEAAKKIVNGAIKVDPDLLLLIVDNHQYKTWSRIAAIYALGFLNHPSSARSLIGIVGNTKEPSQVRSHAAESLGNMRAHSAIPTLARILSRRERASLKKWCVYALGEINTSKSNAVLKKFEATKPTGRVLKELMSAVRPARQHK